MQSIHEVGLLINRKNAQAQPPINIVNWLITQTTNLARSDNKGIIEMMCLVKFLPFVNIFISRETDDCRWLWRSHPRSSPRPNPIHGGMPLPKEDQQPGSPIIYLPADASKREVKPIKSGSHHQLSELWQEICFFKWNPHSLRRTVQKWSKLISPMITHPNTLLHFWAWICHAAKCFSGIIYGSI